MKELIINVPEEAVEFVEEFVERIGGKIEKKRNNAIKKPIAKTNQNAKEISPTFLFGKWKDLDLDPVTFRDKLWPQKKL